MLPRIAIRKHHAEILLNALNEFKNGNFSVRMPVDWKGLPGEIAFAFNETITKAECILDASTRIGHVVGKDGNIEARINLPDISGGWEQQINSMNNLITDIVQPMVEMSRVISSVASGDLKQKLPLKINGRLLRGAFYEMSQIMNTMVEQLRSFASEVTRVAREVGTEGKLGGQADVKGLAGEGTWKELTDNVNHMANNLTNQVRNIAEVTTAVANGDLTRKITVSVQGEILELKNTINTMVDQLSSFASEVTRVAREVGTEGKLGGQAYVQGGAGTWKGLTENVNMLASNLTNQVRNIAEVTTAVAMGDLSKKITVDVCGEFLQLKDTINTMVDQLRAFASEVTRVAREVGTEGKLGGQADVKGVAGTWKDLTENVNMMASNLTSQVRNIAQVTTAVANGDLTRKITVNVKGEILELKNTINTMVDQLSSFASEVTRVAREVGTEGKLGGQATVKGVAGTWKDLTDNVNHMANNLTTQVRNIAEVTTAVANGNLTKKITVDVRGEILELKITINTMVDQLNSFASEVIRVAREVGIEGKLGGQSYVQGVAGTWKALTDNVNQMAGNLTSQVRNIAAVTTAVAYGDLSKKITVDAKGEIFELKSTINIMVDQLSSFAAEVTRVAREVGTEGKLGGQANVRGVAGIWKDLTENVNQMASNLTEQVRSIAKVVTAVALGDLKKKLMVQAKGEVAALSETINNMIDTLATFADQVTSVAREVGVEGRLGGQASVPGAAGTWKDLTDNVNQLAANLTNQVRAISKVARAVTTGDLTRKIRVEAQGEVAALKDIINEMIYNLKETTLKNAEQDWLKTNLAKFTRILQGQKDLEGVARLILSELVPMVSSLHGLFYIADNSNENVIFRILASYAYRERKHVATNFTLGEGLVGQCAYEKERILITKVPTDYIHISSGLGEAKPGNIVVLPVLFEGKVKAIIELGSFDIFTGTQLALLDQLSEIIGIVLNSIETNSRTELLLKQSQSMAQELRSQQEELKKTNEELEEKAKLLAEQNAEVAQKNHEVEIARRALEEKADQLSLTSKYKSEFLANMSHELRTPLNSLLVLSQHLAENSSGNLTAKQIEFAKTISTSGIDLLNLINDILDLSKIESGVASIHIDQVNIRQVCQDIERMFRHIADNKKLTFHLSISNAVPDIIETDGQRLRQVLKNFLSNACKFTSKGSVTLKIMVANNGWRKNHPVLDRTKKVIAFSVSDTGIGIPREKQQVIFEAFQQADGTTSRKYGGCGLGLSISREIAALLGGEITLQSKTGEGSTFTFYLASQHFNAITPVRTEISKRKNNRAQNQLSEEKPIILPASALLPAETLISFQEIPDDIDNLKENDCVLLIISDQTHADEMLAWSHQENFKVIFTSQISLALNLTEQFKPHAIIFTQNIDEMYAWRVLKNLKGQLKTRHIPIFIMNGAEKDRMNALIEGVHTYSMEPVTQKTFTQVLHMIKIFLERKKKRVLLATSSVNQHKNIIELLSDNDIQIISAQTAKESLRLLNDENVDCIILSDTNLVDMNAFQFLEQIKKNKELNAPIIFYTAHDLNKRDETNLAKMKKSAVINVVTTKERLLDETAVYLHRSHASIPVKKRERIEKLHSSNDVLNKKNIMIVDDDIRNIFAMTSTLEDYGIKVHMAENGHDAIKLLKGTEVIDAVLMDIMMPEMDGYETIRKIRQELQYKKLPILAITAKAMKEDRDNCLASGASDYISKPIITEHLLSILRLWLYR